MERTERGVILNARGRAFARAEECHGKELWKAKILELLTFPLTYGVVPRISFCLGRPINFGSLPFDFGLYSPLSIPQKRTLP